MNIFICGINRPLGFRLAEVLRRDHIMLQNYPQIFGSIQKCDQSQLNPSVSKAFNFLKERDLMMRQILNSDVVIIDITYTPSIEIEFVLKVLKHSTPLKKVKIIGISNYMTWSNTKNTQFKQTPHDKDSLVENVLNGQNWKNKQLQADDYLTRVPHPLYLYNYQLQNMIMEFNKNPKMNGTVICTGNIYGRNTEDILDIIHNSIKCRQHLVYGKGENNLPFLHIDNLMWVVEDMVYGTMNLEFIGQEYIVLCEDNSSRLIDFIKTINRKCGNISEIREKSQILLSKKDFSLSLSITLKPSQAVQNFINANNKKNVIEDIDEWFIELTQEFEIQFKHILISEQSLTSQKQTEIKSFIKKYQLLNKEQLNNRASIFIKSNQAQSESKQTEEDKKKPTSKKNDPKNSIIKQPYETVFPQLIKAFLKESSLSNFIICLKQQLLDKISSLQKQIRQQDQIRFIQITHKDKSQLKKENDLVNLIEINSDEFYLIFPDQKNSNQSKQQNQRTEQLKIDQSIKQIQKTQQEKNISDKNDNKIVKLQSQQINLLSQYLLDNLTVYVVEAKYQLVNQGFIEKKGKIEGKQNMKLLVQELKKIRKRESIKVEGFII